MLFNINSSSNKSKNNSSSFPFLRALLFQDSHPSSSELKARWSPVNRCGSVSVSQKELAVIHPRLANYSHHSIQPPATSCMGNIMLQPWKLFESIPSLWLLQYQKS